MTETLSPETVAHTVVASPDCMPVAHTGCPATAGETVAGCTVAACAGAAPSSARLAAPAASSRDRDMGSSFQGW
ncbi:hypothetical protein E6W39_37685 [Kitasatospora acidiphila]|uniref:Uncharacterized protein n=1 Tax=Kitasatospora acidiphila TaxID=2567942 RepID=A0A540WCX3_9ACTN|nr:hypothetical protein E6W39_37685 [Kitasatospora acidiphila]